MLFVADLTKLAVAVLWGAVPVDANAVPEEPARAKRGRLEGRLFMDFSYSCMLLFAIEKQSKIIIGIKILATIAQKINALMSTRIFLVESLISISLSEIFCFRVAAERGRP